MKMKHRHRLAMSPLGLWIKCRECGLEYTYLRLLELTSDIPKHLRERAIRGFLERLGLDEKAKWLR